MKSIVETMMLILYDEKLTLIVVGMTVLPHMLNLVLLAC